jgi:hypothetical protein
MNARTFCQTQLNKAVRRADFIPGNKAIDCSPKDHFLFNPTQFKLSDVAIDNTGNGLTTTAQHDRALIMPGMNFPSDHAIIGCTLETLYVVRPLYLYVVIGLEDPIGSSFAPAMGLTLAFV